MRGSEYQALLQYINTVAERISVDVSGGKDVITGTVKRVEPGLYNVQLANSGNASEIEARPLNSADSFKVDDYVYLLKSTVSSGDTFEDKYFIFGLVEATLEALYNLSDDERFSSNEDINASFTRVQENGFTGFDFNFELTKDNDAVVSFITSSLAFELSMDVKTADDMELITDYGVKIVLYNKNNSELKIFIFNTGYFVGQPFNLDWVNQKKVFSLDAATANELDHIKISAFWRGSLTGGNSIYFNNIKVTAGSISELEGKLTAEISVSGDKNYFYKESKLNDTILLSSVLKYNNQILNSPDIQYYWMIKPTKEVLEENKDKEIEFLNMSDWICMNSCEKVNADGGIIPIWDNDSSTFIFDKSFDDISKYFTKFETPLKCVIKYLGYQIESDEISILNFEHEAIDAVIAANSPNLFISRDQKELKLSCKLINLKTNVETTFGDITYNWYKEYVDEKGETHNISVTGKEADLTVSAECFEESDVMSFYCEVEDTSGKLKEVSNKIEIKYLKSNALKDTVTFYGVLAVTSDTLDKTFATELEYKENKSDTEGISYLYPPVNELIFYDKNLNGYWDNEEVKLDTKLSLFDITSEAGVIKPIERQEVFCWQTERDACKRFTSFVGETPGEKIKHRLWKIDVCIYEDYSVEYKMPVLLSDLDAATLAAKNEKMDVASWAKDVNKTIIDGSILVTGSVIAEQILVEENDEVIFKADGRKQIVNDDGELIDNENFGVYAKDLETVSATMGTLTAGKIVDNTDDPKAIIYMNSDSDSNNKQGPYIEFPKFQVNYEGAINATKGSVGGWEIGEDSLHSLDGNIGLSSSTITEEDIKYIEIFNKTGEVSIEYKPTVKDFVSIVNVDLGETLETGEDYKIEYQNHYSFEITRYDVNDGKKFLLSEENVVLNANASSDLDKGRGTIKSYLYIDSITQNLYLQLELTVILIHPSSQSAMSFFNQIYAISLTKQKHSYYLWAGEEVENELFYVTKSGGLFAKSGRIGPFYLDDTDNSLSLNSGGLRLSESGLYISGADAALTVGNINFQKENDATCLNAEDVFRIQCGDPDKGTYLKFSPFTKTSTETAKITLKYQPIKETHIVSGTTTFWYYYTFWLEADKILNSDTSITFQIQYGVPNFWGTNIKDYSAWKDETLTISANKASSEKLKLRMYEDVDMKYSNGGFRYRKKGGSDQFVAPNNNNNKWPYDANYVFSDTNEYVLFDDYSAIVNKVLNDEIEIKGCLVSANQDCLLGKVTNPFSNIIGKSLTLVGDDVSKTQELTYDKLTKLLALIK